MERYYEQQERWRRNGIILVAKLIVFLSFLLLLCFQARCQTISPLVNECGRKCSGQFLITNNGLAPLIVTVDARSFTPGIGTRPLDATATVQMGDTSARIGPKASHTFYYRLTCDQLPCAVKLMAGIVVGHTTDGLAVKIWLPHTAYLCEKPKSCRAGMLAAK